MANSRPWLPNEIASPLIDPRREVIYRVDGVCVGGLTTVFPIGGLTTVLSGGALVDPPPEPPPPIGGGLVGEGVWVAVLVGVGNAGMVAAGTTSDAEPLSKAMNPAETHTGPPRGGCTMNQSLR